MVSKLLRLLVLAAALAWSQPAEAQDLRIALAIEPTALDPLARPYRPDEQIARHFFDSLVLQDERQRLTPGLALSWSVVDDMTWEFRLRRGVRFSDGSEFAAEDVAAALRRAVKAVSSPGGYGIYTRQITEIDVVDSYTIRLHTAAPYPLMPYDLSAVWIISRKAETATAEEFNSGRVIIGTGPFRFAERVNGERLVMKRNEEYWGVKPAWKRVVVVFIPNDSSRIAALLSGDVDFIEQVLPSALADLRRHTELETVEAQSNRVYYLHLDSYRDRTPFATDLAGALLDRNPLKDWRVRKAISKAIDRRAIVDRVMDGLAMPAGQLIPEGYFGASDRLVAEPYDPGGARRLLAEAGYPDGFGITLHAYNDRAAVALGQMLSRAGIQTRIETLPESVFKSRAAKYEYSLFMSGWSAETAEASAPLRGLVATQGLQGWGQTNRGRYSNPELDRLLVQAMGTMDDGAREKLLQRATETAMNDVAVIPVYFEGIAWAFRKGLAYKGRTDQFTLAQDVTRVP